MHSKLTSRVLAGGAVAAAATLLLVACGGGGGDATPVSGLLAGTDVPTSATASSDGASAFVASLAAAPADSIEPITVGDAVLASSDSAEPAEL